ncbi:PqqD family protein [Nitrosomonas sp.]|uniref:PqqD family protein n=1 Tax=Nitrosomonas sp. TaxID=42353 RepID=UPI0025D1C3CF|nr:PqqD family protein [Nitrosomonas sp.]
MKNLFDRNLSLIESEVGNNLLLYDTVKEVFFVLNPPTKFIWLLYSEEDSITPIIQMIKKYYKHPAREKEIMDDVIQMVDELKKNKILIPADNTKSSHSQSLNLSTSIEEQYSKPTLRSLTKEWMLEYHPDSYYRGSHFSDLWDS